MEPAREELAAAIENTVFGTPKCAVYQNVDAKGHTDINDIKTNELQTENLGYETTAFFLS